MLCGLIFSACNNVLPGSNSTPDKTKLADLSFDYSYTEDQIKTFTANDTADLIAAAGPFYAGAVPYQQPALQALQEAKKNFVSQLQQETEDLFNQTKTYHSSLLALQKSL